MQLPGARAKAVLAVLVLSAACAGLCLGSDPAPSPEAAQRLATLEKEGEALNRAADALEARLLAGQTALVEWDELARRHHEVSALACRMSTEHLEGMVRQLEQQEQKSRRLHGEAMAQAASPAYAE